MATRNFTWPEVFGDRLFRSGRRKVRLAAAMPYLMTESRHQTQAADATMTTAMTTSGGDGRVCECS